MLLSLFFSVLLVPTFWCRDRKNKKLILNLISKLLDAKKISKTRSNSSKSELFKNSPTQQLGYYKSTLEDPSIPFNLTILTTKLPSDGGPVSFIAESESVEFLLDLAVFCNENFIVSYNFNTSIDIQQFAMPSSSPSSLCTVYATQTTNQGNTESGNFTVYGVYTIELPINGTDLYQNTPFNLKVHNSDSPTQETLVNVTFTCSNGEQLIQIDQNLDDPNATINAPLIGGCEIFAIAADPSIYYQTFDNITVNLLNNLTLSVANTYPTASSKLSYSLYFTQALVTSVQLKLTCNSVVIQTVDTSSTSDESTQTFVISSAAIGVCNLQAFPDNQDYSDSNSVELIIFQQLYFASSLQGWTGGQSVSVNLTSPNLEVISLNLITTCSIGSYNQLISTSTDSLYNVPLSLNGVTCLLTTPSVPSFYLPPLATVNIAISQIYQVVIIEQLDLTNLLNAPKRF